MPLESGAARQPASLMSRVSFQPVNDYNVRDSPLISEHCFLALSEQGCLLSQYLNLVRVPIDEQTPPCLT